MRYFLNRQWLPLHARTLDVQLEHRLAARLEEFDPELMRPGRKLRGIVQLKQAVIAIVVDDEAVVDIQFATVVGLQIEGVVA